MHPNPSPVMPGNWRKSSHSGQNGDCVEAASDAGLVLVRDTKRRDGPVLEVPAGAWREFAAALKTR